MKYYNYNISPLSTNVSDMFIFLPTEILVNIIQLIPDKDLVNFFLCCKTFNNVNTLLTEDFWLDRGKRILRLDLSKITCNIDPDDDLIRIQYRHISNSLRQFCCNVTNDRGTLLSYQNVALILDQIRLSNYLNLLNFVKNADYFMIPWTKFIKRELSSRYSAYGIRDLLIIPLVYEHVVTILAGIINNISDSDIWYFKDVIITFFDNMIVVHDINKIDVLMELMSHYLSFSQVGSVGLHFVNRIHILQFDQELVSNCVWKHLYKWNSFGRYPCVKQFLSILRNHDASNLENLLKFDKGKEIDGKYVYLSCMVNEEKQIQPVWSSAYTGYSFTPRTFNI